MNSYHRWPPWTTLMYLGKKIAKRDHHSGHFLSNDDVTNCNNTAQSDRETLSETVRSGGLKLPSKDMQFHYMFSCLLNHFCPSHPRERSRNLSKTCENCCHYLTPCLPEPNTPSNRQPFLSHWRFINLFKTTWTTRLLVFSCLRTYIYSLGRWVTSHRTYIYALGSQGVKVNNPHPSGY